MASSSSTQPPLAYPYLSPELNAAASLHADYSAKLSKHLTRQLDDLMQEVPDIQPPAGMGSFTGGDYVISAAYELANETSGHIPTATRELRAFFQEFREQLDAFDRTPPPAGAGKLSEKEAALAILTNVENGLAFMEAQAEQLETLKGFFKDIIYC
ncbi:hypothetical protein A1Q1_03028 [Trichosporon asahii var. asahii CBS 2479]|uniref:Uncharacterized protein n=1 Tax=Trichosporon asahii var. asahii (strain ATCC 90039 / CBS 2479 / JCM 2466 / KCTC 7840 / NBRC 103889/ NCYC 2677 / UAMH 7654) TaxID=1186058 RepID=J4UB31_TRIAS|nr:hypothetical protein A1Q1_03028 [Trichosporon asahii var. asahii CBS 2479]EJT47990.1 hypothetical protein A1Q1_03028 [Trichosporon asahii var. asahii CBS 2479]